MSEQRKYRTFTPEQKAEIVLADLRGDRTVGDACRQHETAETRSYLWRDRLLEGGRAASVSVRVSRARAVVAHGRRPAVVARVAGISR